MYTIKFRALLLVLFFLIGSSAALSQSDGPNFMMDPILVERVARPGDLIRYMINMENQDDFNPLVLDIKIADITERPDGSYELVPAGTTPYSASRWLKTNVSRIVVPPRSLREVEVTLNVPRGVSGGLYGAVVFIPVTAGPADEEEALGVTEFVFQMASFLEVVIQGTAIREEAYAAGFEVGLSKDYAFLRSQVGDGALVFSASVLNQGNVHIVTRGELQIKTIDNRTVARYPLGGGRGVILPGATVSLMTVVTRRLPPGEYIARAVVDYAKRRPIVSEVLFVVEESGVKSDFIDASEMARFLVDPSEVEITGRPGAFKSAVVELTNRGEEPVEIVSKVLPLVYDIFGDLIPEGDRTSEALSWIELNPASFSIDPGKTRRIRLSANLPRESEGAYYADIVFRSTGTEAIVEGGLSLLVLSGESFTRKASIDLLSIQEIDGAINADFVLRNEGNIHLYATSEIALNRFFEQVILESGQILAARSEQMARMTIPLDNSPILPGADRLLSIMLPSELEAGQYEILLRLDYGGAEPATFRARFSIGGGQND
jgi:hypothetical protein